jgi:rare lipoprotein A
LRIDGAPAQFDRSRPPTMVAEQQPQAVQTAAAIDPLPPPPPPPYPPIREEAPAAAPMPAERMVLASAPLPPTRPFDLGTIPGAAVPIGARPTSPR